MVNAEVVDLHTHTSHSDGVLSPVQLIQRAAEHHVTALAITDHDSVDAYLEPTTYEAAEQYGVELVPGIELSTVDEDNCKIHVLGLFIDPHDSGIDDVITRQQLSRHQYAADVSQLLQADGWNIDVDSLLSDKALTKAHIADSVILDSSNTDRLAKEFGDFPTRGKFIETLMNEGGPYFVERHSISPGEAIDVIHAAGGLAILAHPVANTHEGTTYERVVNLLNVYDFDGLEAIYYYFSKSQGDRKIDEIDKYVGLAKELGLLVTGGSDFHGASPTLGNFVEVGFEGEEQAPGKDVLNVLKTALSAKG